MMITKAFCLYDLKTGIFGVPFFMPHLQHAIRAVQDLGNDLNTTVGRHPADYMLMEIGTYDDQTGGFDTAHHSIGTVVGFLKPAVPAPLFESPVEQGCR